ncbi:MAG: response regulator transcription factor [Chitinophagaceae bacterium]|nr:MAG: response regulator transcription factor [Chitinophagaceae bacterium]
MNVVIVEDEPLSARRLATLVRRWDPSVEILAELPSVAEAVDWFRNHPEPDLVFMDIHLEDGQSFSIFDAINLDVPVIFTTAFDAYMVKAFKVNSVDYLMKPVGYEELAGALDKFRRLHRSEAAPVPHGIESLLRTLQGPSAGYRDRFLISAGSRLHTIDVKEVQYFYSAEKLTFIVTADGHRYPIDGSLDKLSGQLDPRRFFRVNRQLMAGIDAIRNIQVFPKGRLRLDLDPPMKEEVFVSLDKVTEFKEWLGK